MNSAPRFTKAAPILYVKDLDAEVAFYLKLGFQLVYRGEEFPGFVALGCERFGFGLETKESFNPDKVPDVLLWQLETASLRPVLDMASAENWRIDGPRCYWPEHDAWEMSIWTPNGYRLALEGPNPDLR